MISIYSDKSPHLPAPQSALDVRVRLLIVLASSASVLILSSPAALMWLFVASAVYLGTLKRFKLQIIVYIILIIFSAMSVGFMKLLPMTRDRSNWLLVVPLLRMGVMANVVLSLALSMRLRNVLSLMKMLRLPRILYLPLSVTVRFIPALIEDMKQIGDCLKLRGYTRWALLRPRLWLLPVIFRSLHLSDELAIAAELKAVGYGQPVKIPSPPLITRTNISAIIACAVLLIASLHLQNMYPPPATSMRAMGNGHPGSAVQTQDIDIMEGNTNDIN